MSFDICPDHGYAVGFVTKVDHSSDPDQTGMNGIKLMCNDAESSVLTSTVGSFGAWHINEFQKCPGGYDGVDTRIQPKQVNTYNRACCSVSKLTR